jgi:DNA ligase-1
MNIKPLLASPVTDFDTIRFPKLASQKIDGIRCLTVPPPNRMGKKKCNAVSRNGKPIPNAHIRNWIEESLDPGYDGELVAVDENGKTLPFNECSSAIMSRSGTPDFKYLVFDFNENWQHGHFAFEERLKDLVGHLEFADDRVQMVPHHLMNDLDELDAFEGLCLSEGYEGVMIRDPRGGYKQGRSTEREGILLKIKRFEQNEATVVGVEEEMENTNEKTLERGGKASRSNHAAGMVGKNRLGALIVEMPIGNEGKLTFKIGSGFTQAQRIQLWGEPNLHGRIVTFKHQPSGAKEAPRFPTFIGFRHANDL